MKTIQSPSRKTKDDILRARCCEQLKARLYRMSATLDKDVSDIIREACAEKLLKFEQSLATLAG